MEIDKKKKKNPSIVSGAISGTLGSVLAEVILFPIDTIKLHVQTSVKDTGGFLQTGLQIVSQHGLRGLYAGVGGALFKESIHSMNYWLWHGVIFKLGCLHGDSAKTPAMRRLLLNLISKQLNWLCTVPFEVVSSVNQLREGTPGFFSTAVFLYKKDGIGAFYRGLAVSLLLAINPAIMNTLVTTFLGLATTFKKACGSTSEDAIDLGPVATGLSTGISKACATILTYPLIRAKVLQQTKMEGVDKTLRQVLMSTLAEEGVQGLYRGIVAMSYKTVIWNSLMMAFRQMLGTKPSITPPGTPPAEEGEGQVMGRFMGREPFPVELLTGDKLDEILRHLRMNKSSVDEARVDSIEKGLGDVSSELKEVKDMLKALTMAVQK